METQEKLNYNRIANAIGYVRQNFRSQPRLEEIAGFVNMSPFHFQRMFHEWAGVTPKQFLQYLSVEYAKKILDNPSRTLFDATCQTGLSGTGRLHDLFVKVEGMTPGEYKNGGQSLTISYSFADSPFGRLLIASTGKGICYLAFAENDEETELGMLKTRFPNATYLPNPSPVQNHVLSVFNQEQQDLQTIKLHLKGTDFQIKVWEALLKIPVGGLTTYGELAREAGYEKASRAVGTAIGSNPVAFLIPCHRVIRSTGIIGDYRWGSIRKSALIGWEAAQTSVGAE